MLSAARRFATRRPTILIRCSEPHKACRRYCRHHSTDHKLDEPLRVLFCGSDYFSISCLRALHHYAQEPGSNVESIDVATKTDKRTGRGLKLLKPPAIKPVAQELGLRLHQFDTFRGWQLPRNDGAPETYINIVIAVSFGLLVPPRILGACRFGGLNVHPSMLPDLKGSAPIEHTILNGYDRSGVTVQTLHPSNFDEGHIVAQTAAPGVRIPQHDQITTPQLGAMLADIGADMLVRTLQERRYLGPHSSQPTVADTGLLKHAPKVTTEDRHIHFATMTAPQILRRNRALGQLWARPPLHQNASVPAGQDLRIKFSSDMRLLVDEENAALDIKEAGRLVANGVPFCLADDELATPHAVGGQPLWVKTADEQYLCLPQMAFSGKPIGPSAQVAARAHLLQERGRSTNNSRLYTFSAQC